MRNVGRERVWRARDAPNVLRVWRARDAPNVPRGSTGPRTNESSKGRKQRREQRNKCRHAHPAASFPSDVYSWGAARAPCATSDLWAPTTVGTLSPFSRYSAPAAREGHGGRRVRGEAMGEAMGEARGRIGSGGGRDAGPVAGRAIRRRLLLLVELLCRLGLARAAAAQLRRSRGRRLLLLPRPRCGGCVPASAIETIGDGRPGRGEGKVPRGEARVWGGAGGGGSVQRVRRPARRQWLLSSTSASSASASSTSASSTSASSASGSSTSASSASGGGGGLPC